MKESEKIVSIGWDVGGFTTKKNRFWAVEWNGKEPGLQINKVKPEPTISDYYDLKSIIGKYDSYEQIIIAIDSPFRYPAAIVPFINDKEQLNPKSTVGEEIDNPLIYRTTDRHINEKFGKKPLSPIFEKLGRNVAMVISTLRKWKKEHEEKIAILPFDLHETKKIVIIEVYPGILLGSKEPAEEMKAYFKDIISPEFRDCYNSIYILKKAKDKIKGNDDIDAIICALMGREIWNKKDLTKSEEIKQEGWIYYPEPPFNSFASLDYVK